MSNDEVKHLLGRALYYTNAALRDMQYQATMENLEGFNMNTDGTPHFESDEELGRYLSEMEMFVNQMKEVVEHDMQ